MSDALDELRWNPPPQYFEPRAFRSPSASSTRLVAGQTGSGKSRQLMTLQQRVSALDGVVTLHDRDALWGRSLRSLYGRSPSGSVEFWRAVWRAAFLSFTASVVATNFHGLLDEEDRLRLTSLYNLRYTGGERFLNERSGIIRPTAQVNAYATRGARSGFFFDAAWDQMAAKLDELREKLPAIHLFMESPEDAWRTEPGLMFKCSEGMCLEILADDSTDQPSTKANVVAAVRTSVLAQVQQDNAKYRGSDKILALGWSHDELRRFVRARLKDDFGESFLQKSRLSGPFERITGVATIQVEERGNNVETATHYVLRHCSQPRDTINMCNALLAVRDTANPRAPIAVEVLKQVVSREADAVGNELVNQAATALAALSQVEDPKAPDYKSVLLRWIRDLDTDVVDADALRQAQAAWPDDATRPVLSDQLWRNGLIATFGRDGYANYFSAVDATWRLPPSAHGYVLHPSMIEMVGLRPSEVPIRLFKRGLR